MNISTLSRPDLVRELLAPPSWQPTGIVPYVGDGEAAYRAGPAGDHVVLHHKLGVARRLLLLDLQESMCDGPLMDSPDTLKDWLRLYCADLEHEVFMVLHLTAQHRLIDVEELFRGTLTQTTVYPREVVKSAIARNAAAVIFAHNHPSGQADPSSADERLTATLKAALYLVDVRVADHLVVAGTTVVSFAEQGLI